ncbi:MAG TPA: (2Fe-2S)-binding protein [Acidimicrobiales bacterium]|nr:(2Fe-2S)-binding protein [Acidimicrobiales bacterium]
MRARFTLNGAPVETDVAPASMLLDLVRERGLTGTKEGCAVGICGVCTVLVDDRPVSSCLYLCGFLDGADVWTVEGLVEREPELADAFVECEGMQCGICTPGQVVAAAALRLRSPGAGAAEVREELAGNLCRCTGYETIVEAVMRYLERS